MREEYSALQWIKLYMPQRHWMMRNNVDFSNYEDELHYQELEKKFLFTKRRQQIML